MFSLNQIHRSCQPIRPLSISRISAILFIAVFALATTPTKADWPGVRLTRVLGTGDPAPGVPGSTMTYVANPFMTNEGVMVFGTASGPGAPTAGIWFGRPGRVEPVALTGMQAPDMPAGVVIDSILPLFNASEDGTILFSAILDGPGIQFDQNDAALFAGQPGRLRKLMQSGDPSDQFPTGVLPGGQVIFENRMADDGSLITMISDSSFGFEVVFVGTIDHLEPLVWTGMPVPDAPGVFIGCITAPVITDGGFYSFHSSLEGPAVDSTNNLAFFGGLGLEYQMYLREGDPAPGFEQGAIVTRVAHSDQIGGNGQAGFLTRVLTPNAIDDLDCIHLCNMQGCTLVAAEGQQFPGLAIGVTYETPGLPNINALSEVLHGARVQGTGITEDNDRYIMRWVQGEDRIILAEGDPIPFTEDVVFIASTEGVVTADNSEVACMINRFSEWVMGSTLMFSPDKGMTWRTIVRHGDVHDSLPVACVEYPNFSTGANGGFSIIDDYQSLALRLIFFGGDEAIYVASLDPNGDFDSDGDVDLADFGVFQLCFTGAVTTESLDSECATIFDTDFDADIDLVDFSSFQLNFTGPQ